MNALTATTYGRVLLGKLVGVIVLVLLGNLARLWVKRHLCEGMHGSAPLDSLPGDELVAHGQGAALVRGLIAETTVAFTVLAVTAALVVIVPAR